VNRFFSRLAEERAKIGFFVMVLVFCTAPTPGDVGGCGQKPAELDPGTFFASKANIDCQRCRDCSLTRVSCENACDFPESYPSTFPDDCVPLVHDGEVCLRALLHASCDDYGSYMSDRSPSVPTECNFCPERAP
jgi:hypothetical protein